MKPVVLASGFVAILVATGVASGCGPPAVWSGSGWVDRIEGAFAVIVVAGREETVARSRLPPGIAEGDFVRNSRLIPSRRELFEARARDKLMELAD